MSKGKEMCTKLEDVALFLEGRHLFFLRQDVLPSPRDQLHAWSFIHLNVSSQGKRQFLRLLAQGYMGEAVSTGPDLAKNMTSLNIKIHRL